MLLAIGILLFTFYVIFMLISIQAWKKLGVHDGINHSELRFSVVIPCKNEAHNIPGLFATLSKLNYPTDKFEAIFVDDHSSDDTASLIQDHCNKSGFTCKLLVLQDGHGKKSALALGIENSNFDHILTTDADCELPMEFLHSYSNCFSSLKADFIAGPVIMRSSGTFFSKIQSLEFAVLSAIGASFFAFGRPFMCNGANLGFSKSLYTEMGGYSDHLDQLSGDDVLFLHQAKKRKKRIAFNRNPNAIVPTAPNTGLRSFVQQRLRWAGKSTSYRDVDSIAIALLIFMYNLFLIVFFIMGIFNASYFGLFFFLFVSKFILDIAFVYSIRKFYQLEDVFFQSIVLSLIYPFYAVAIGLISLIAPVKWK